jgi:hypothetical protein
MMEEKEEDAATEGELDAALGLRVSSAGILRSDKSTLVMSELELVLSAYLEGA